MRFYEKCFNSVHNLSTWSKNLASIYRIVLGWLWHHWVQLFRVGDCNATHVDTFSYLDAGGSIYEIDSRPAVMSPASSISCSVNTWLMFSWYATRSIILLEQLGGLLDRHRFGQEPTPHRTSHYHHRCLNHPSPQLQHIVGKRHQNDACKRRGSGLHHEYLPQHKIPPSWYTDATSAQEKSTPVIFDGTIPWKKWATIWWVQRFV